MANTYTKIASVSLTTSTAAIDFTSIPATYTDLVIIYSLRGTNAGTFAPLNMTFNNSTSGYSNKSVFGTSTTAYSYSYTTLPYLWGGYYQGNAATANTFGNGQIYIPNYAGSANKNCSIDQVGENNAVTADAAFCTLNAGLWSNSAAITSVKLENEYGNWAQYSNAYLYGIKNS